MYTKGAFASSIENDLLLMKIQIARAKDYVVLAEVKFQISDRLKTFSLSVMTRQISPACSYVN